MTRLFLVMLLLCAVIDSNASAQDAVPSENLAPQKVRFKVDNTNGETCRIEIIGGKLVDGCQSLGQRACGAASSGSRTRLVARGEYLAVLVSTTHVDVIPDFFVCLISE